MLTSNTRIKHKNLIGSALAPAIFGSVFTQSVAAYDFNQAATEFFKLGQEDAKYGQIKLDLRYRFEIADVADNGKQTAYANTLRLRLGYLTPKFYGLQAFAEYEGNLAMQPDYFVPQGSWHGDPNRDVVADPQHSELNQLWLSFTGFPDTEIKGGRQRIKLDDERFIGNVGWRQLEQTFDSVLVTNASIEHLTLKAGYIGRVQNIFSELVDMKVPFFNFNYQFKDLASITTYGLWLADGQSAAKSTQSLGIAATGSPRINDQLQLHYRAEYSYQSDYAKNPNSFDLNRYHVMAGASFLGITLKGGAEELGSNGRQSFQTPLGTNHAFQGWADVFLVTPVDGVQDVYASLAGQVLGAGAMFVYHNFQSATNDFEYGNEYDFLLTKKLGDNYLLLAKYAYYDGDRSAPGKFSHDVHKFWLQASVNF